MALRDLLQQGEIFKNVKKGAEKEGVKKGAGYIYLLFYK